MPWIVLFVVRPLQRRHMLGASVLTMPLGLTEPLFVPGYWNPPSLFDLAQRTGFDIESLIFSFALGGLAASGYRPQANREGAPKHATSPGRQLWHRGSLATAFVVFPALLPLPWNPIYAAIGALLAGALGTALCRPDLCRGMAVGGMVFLTLYVVFLLGLKWMWPGYIEAVWNLADLLQWRPAGLPMEELWFGLAFGMYWSSAYEHFSGSRPRPGSGSASDGSGALRRRAAPGHRPDSDRHLHRFYSRLFFS